MFTMNREDYNTTTSNTCNYCRALKIEKLTSTFRGFYNYYTGKSCQQYLQEQVLVMTYRRDHLLLQSTIYFGQRNALVCLVKGEPLAEAQSLHSYTARTAPELQILVNVLRCWCRCLEAECNIDQDAQEHEPANEHHHLPRPHLGIFLHRTANISTLPGCPPCV